MGTQFSRDKSGSTCIEKLLISSIQVDFEIHSRTHLDKKTVHEYAEAMKRGSIFPSGIVFYNNDFYWLADGFHRLEARKLAGFETLAVEILPGGKRDAILFSSQSNSDHGLRRTNRDKRYVVRRILQDPEWSLWSDSEIARRCHVTHPLVGKIRKELESTCNNYKLGKLEGESATTNSSSMRRARKNDKTYVINTKKIGQTSKSNLNFKGSASTEELEKTDNLILEGDTEKVDFSDNRLPATSDNFTKKVQILEVNLNSKTHYSKESEIVCLNPQILCKDKGEALLLILLKMKQYPDFANRVYQEAKQLN
ncbi:hypothetical protein D0962_37710 [Leptolyngbyaceae cyanobacterium CCMR0082]|uniref:ParB/Sulfiredoxin domain-containing protein n=1 Tax=Adonisia turfae CCMR0082 TaxID=2304604 RepID=A0A6M0SMG5_9CYAN|nr:ParB N-terminal domain-containing protein [Adonisia turfae]NEZ68392.1 hypothetical protein [Adonisia turfae CCMR0082]